MIRSRTLSLLLPLVAIVALLMASGGPARAHDGGHQSVQAGDSTVAGKTRDSGGRSGPEDHHCHPGGSDAACQVASAISPWSGPSLERRAGHLSRRPAVGTLRRGRSHPPPSPPPILVPRS